jgi:hypothetical protein
METTSAIRATGSISRQGLRQRSRKKAKDKNSASSFNGHGFLKHSFLPLADGRHEELEQWQAVEREFFASLSHLTSLYGFTPKKASDSVFPENIRNAYRHAAEQLKAVRPDLSLIIVQDETHPACLATIKPLNTGVCLYYVPIRPLWDLLRDRKQKKLANLLLSVYAYLYKVVQVPHYRDGGIYLGTTYEMMQDWTI